MRVLSCIFVAPRYFQDAAEASQLVVAHVAHVARVAHVAILPGARGQGLSAVKQCIDDACVVRYHLGLRYQLGVSPYSCFEALRERQSVILEPKYVNCWTTPSS